jgi:hypothetical protein
MMSKLDKKQKEAIRALARITAANTKPYGTNGIDKDKEKEEIDRLNNYIGSGFIDNSYDIEDKEFEKYSFPIRILFYILFLLILGYGGYGIMLAFVNA